MLGTIVNALAIAIGGAIGLLFKNGLGPRVKSIVTQALGLCVLFIGLSGALKNMLDPDANGILFIISMVIGGIVGEGIDIEAKLLSMGKYLERKIGEKEGSIAKGFVTASLLFCVGTMSILGSLESGMQGIHNTLFAKSLLDGISAIIFASTFGVGVLLSAVSVFVYQGILTLAASVIAPFLTVDMLREIGLIGGILISALGLNMLGIKKFKVGNLLPAVLVPVIYYFILRLF